MEENLEGEDEKVSEMFRVEDQAVLYIKRLGSTVGTLVKEIFHASVSGMRIYFLEKRGHVKQNAADG